jgi:hypothetical protein
MPRSTPDEPFRLERPRLRTSIVAPRNSFPSRSIRSDSPLRCSANVPFEQAEFSQSQTAYAQIDADPSATQRDVSEIPYVAAVRPHTRQPHPVHPAGGQDLVRAETTTTGPETSTETTRTSANCGNNWASSTEHNLKTARYDEMIYGYENLARATFTCTPT